MKIHVCECVHMYVWIYILTSVCISRICMRVRVCVVVGFRSCILGCGIRSEEG